MTTPHPKPKARRAEADGARALAQLLTHTRGVHIGWTQDHMPEKERRVMVLCDEEHLVEALSMCIAGQFTFTPGTAPARPARRGGRRG